MNDEKKVERKEEYESVNTVTLTGQVAGEIEILPSGNGVLTVKTVEGGNDGWSKQPVTSFHRVMIPERQLQRYLRKNLTDRDRVLVRGRRKTSFFWAEGGEKGYDENVNAASIDFSEADRDKNNVTIVGKIVKAPMLKIGRGGEPFVRFTIATTEQSEFRTEKRGEENWHNVLLKGKDKAERFFEAYRYGSVVGITGRISYTSQNGDNGRRIYATILANLYFPVRETVFA